MVRKMVLVCRPQLAKKRGGMAACRGRPAGPERRGLLESRADTPAANPVLPSAQPLALRVSCPGEGLPPRGLAVASGAVCLCPPRAEAASLAYAAL